MSHNSTVVGEDSHVQLSSFMIYIHIKVDGHQSMMRIPNMVDDHNPYIVCLTMAQGTHVFFHIFCLPRRWPEQS